MSLHQIAATQQLMGIALNQQNNIDGLIGYYRDQIDKFNDEKAEWSINYEHCKKNVSNKYMMDKEISDCKARIQKLEGILGVLKNKLNKERQKYFNKLQQGSKIKINYQKNQQKVRQTMNLCKPIDRSQLNQTSFFNRGCGSSIDQKPNNNNPELQLELINMIKRHEKNKNYLQNTIDILKKSLEELVEENSIRTQNCSQEYRDTYQKLVQLQLKQMNLNCEYFKLKMSNSDQQMIIQQKSQILRLKNTALMQKLKKLQKSHTSEYRLIQIEVKNKNKQFKQKYDYELKKKQEHLSILKQQHQRISDIYLQKIKKLQNQLNELIEKNKIITVKSKTQLNSLKGQIKILNGRLEKQSIRKMRDQIVNDKNNSEEQEDNSNALEPDELDQINREVRDLEKKIGGVHS